MSIQVSPVPSKLHFPGLRGWMESVRGLGKLREIHGASWNLEIGALTDLNVKGPKWTLLFGQIPGYPDRYRVLTGTMPDVGRVALVLGLSPELQPMELVQILRRKLAAMGNHLSEYRAEQVTDAPFLAHTLEGPAIDILKFPVPKWHEKDGGRFVGTASAVITRDPDSGWVNLGAYRSQVHEDGTVGVAIGPGRHGRIHLEKYEQRGQPCPVAVSYGHHPLFNMVSSMEVPMSVCEYDYAGALLEQRIPVVAGPVTGLPIPADSELVVEGYIPAGERHVEGPHGEFMGYYASDRMAKNFIRIAAIHHRDDPIMTGTRSGWPPHDYSYYRCPLRSAMLWNAVEQAGLSGVKGVWCHEAGLSRALTVISIRQAYAGHAEQAGFLASQVREGIHGGRWVIVVDDDIDPSDTDAMLWAVSSRTDPAYDVEFIRNSMSSPVDPMAERMTERGADGGPPELRSAFAARVSRAVVNACHPYQRFSRGTHPQTVETIPSSLVEREAELRRMLED